jgi:hypothetical protein
MPCARSAARLAIREVLWEFWTLSTALGDKIALLCRYSGGRRLSRHLGVVTRSSETLWLAWSNWS